MQWLADVYREYRRELLLTAWSVLRQQDLAEDAVHAAFARLSQIPKIPRDPKPYVFKTVRNSAIGLRTTHARRREQPLDSVASPVAASAADADQERLEAVRQAIEGLDEASREVVELHLQASLTFQEIADLLNEPLSTAASRYRRALEKIRRQLEVRNG